MSKNNLSIAINIIVICVFVLSAYHVTGALNSGELFGFEYRGNEVDIYIFISIVVMTVLGVITGCMYDYLQNHDNNGTAWWLVLLDALKSKSFGLSLLATPMIVFVVFDQIASAKLDYGILLFCFQSGFFWNRTMKVIGENYKFKTSTNKIESNTSIL